MSGVASGPEAAGPGGGATGLRVLVVEDELPAREELAYLLRRDRRVARVDTAGDGADALRALQAEPVDAVFLDIKMPGLDGLDLARVLAQFAAPPPVVFVTAHDEHAVAAFELDAVDYLLKPVREERLAEAVRRVAAAGSAASAGPAAAAGPADGTAGGGAGTAGGAGAGAEEVEETIAVELAGVTRFVAIAQVRYAQAHGDYARLFTASASHLVRVPLTALEERWAPAGFVRIHRRHLVALRHIDEVRLDAGRWTVRLGEVTLHVSRRHTRELRDLLLARAAARPPG